MTLEALEPSPDGTWREAEVGRRVDAWFGARPDRAAMRDLQSVRFRIWGEKRLEVLAEARGLEIMYPMRRDEIRQHYGLSLGPPSNSAYSVPPEALEHKAFIDEWLLDWNERDRAIRGALE